MGKILAIFVEWIQSIIGGLIVVIFLLISYLLFRWVFKGKEESKGDVSPEAMKGVESSIKSLIEQLKDRPAAAPAPAAPTVEGAPKAEANPAVELELKEKQTQLDQAQARLTDKEKEIEKLRADIQKLGGQSSQSTELQSKIAELEAKLAEYEIIEDDIADLSFYKEENDKLKKELENIKRAGPAAPVAQPEVSEAPPAKAESAPAASKDQSDFDQEFASELEAALKQGPPADDLATLAGEAVSELDPAPPPVEEPPKPSAVEAAPAAPKPAPVPVEPPPAPKPSVEAATAAVPPPPKPAPPKTEKKESQVVGDDIMAEFSGFDEFKPSDEEWSKSVNTDKMLEEVAGLSDSSEGSALEEATDVDRMAKEATELQSKVKS